MSTPVHYQTKDGIGTICLDNPEHSNPIDLNTLTDLAQAFRTSKEQKDVCVIYRASGKNFTYGANLKFTSQLLTNPDFKAEAACFPWAWQEVTSAMMAHPGIVIVGYHGWVVGGGFEHTLGSDLRIAAQDTKILMPELDMGIFFSNGATKILPLLIGESRAKQMMFLGEKITAQTALQFGLVTEVCEPEVLDDRLLSYAQKLVAKEPYALQLAKKSVHKSRTDTLDGALYDEGCAMVTTGRSDAVKERIQAFLDK